MSTVGLDRRMQSRHVVGVPGPTIGRSRLCDPAPLPFYPREKEARYKAQHGPTDSPPFTPLASGAWSLDQHGGIHPFFDFHGSGQSFSVSSIWKGFETQAENYYGSFKVYIIGI